LVFNDGQVVSVDADTVIGRIVTAPGVPVIVDDPEVSRRHWGARVVDGRLLVTDTGSRHGTFLLEPGADEPRRVERGQTVEAPVGTRISFGSSWADIQRASPAIADR